MLNINDLESRHRKYKMVVYLQYVTIFALVIFILFLAYFIKNYVYGDGQTNKIPLKNSAINSSLQLDTNTSINALTSIKKDDNLTHNNTMTGTKGQVDKNSSENKIIFTPSLDFMKNIQLNSPKNSMLSIKAPQNKAILSTPIIAPARLEEVVIDVVPIQKKQTIKIENRAPEKITINKDESNIQDVIKRFNINKNPALSLFIAKRYYQLAEYESSYNYALLTNNIDSNIDESWIIFAKSLVKLNQKDKAVHILEQYISSTKSQNAKIFLDDLKTGKFK